MASISIAQISTADATKKEEEESRSQDKGNVLTDFDKYDDFLDSHITPLDLHYLEDIDLARDLIELGYKGSGEMLKREDFEARKAEAEARRLSKMAPPFSFGPACQRTQEPFLCALAAREDQNRTGKMTTIIFLRDQNARGQEVSAYIDFADRLQRDVDCKSYCQGRKRIMPRPSDLSYFNWDTMRLSMNSSPNYEVMAQSVKGLLFKNKRDRKIINVDPERPSPGDNTERHAIKSGKYTQVVFYDHTIMRKADH